MFWLGSRHPTADWSRTLNDGGHVPGKKPDHHSYLLFPYFVVIDILSADSHSYLFFFPYFDVIHIIL